MIPFLCQACNTARVAGSPGPGCCRHEKHHPRAFCHQEGEVGAGDLIELVETDPQRMTVEEMNRLLYFDPKNVEDAKRAIRIEALSPGWRGSFEDRLEKAGVSFNFIENTEDGPFSIPPAGLNKLILRELRFNESRRRNRKWNYYQ